MLQPLPTVDEVIEYAKTKNYHFIWGEIGSGNKFCGVGMLWKMLQAESTNISAFKAVAYCTGLTIDQVAVIAFSFDDNEDQLTRYRLTCPDFDKYHNYGRELRQRSGI